MARLQFYGLLVVALATPGCAPQMAPEPATKFFTNPHDLMLAESLQRSDWVGAERAIHDGANPNVIGNEAMYPLIWTMYLKNKGAFEWLLDHGADPNMSSVSDSHDERISVLFFSAEADDPDWLRMLLAHGANPNLKRRTVAKTTETVIYAALDNYRIAQLKMLIAAGANINYQIPETGATPSSSAAQASFFEAAYLLLEAGADIRPRDFKGWNMAREVARNHFALNEENAAWRQKVLQQLRDRGADVDGAIRDAQAAEEKRAAEDSR